MSPAREPFSSVTLYCTAGFWLHGDWERAAWRLLSFLSVRDGNTRGLWGWLLEILWRGLWLAQTLQARDHIGHWLRTRKTGHRMVVEVPTRHFIYRERRGYFKKYWTVERISW